MELGDSRGDLTMRKSWLEGWFLSHGLGTQHWGPRSHAVLDPCSLYGIGSACHF